MTISLYQASVPLLVRGLQQLMTILDKAVAHAEAQKIDPAVLVNAHLYPNMFPLVRQVQIATDTAKGCGARLAGKAPPSYADTEATFAELKARIEKTIAFLETCKAADIAGSEARDIHFKFGSDEMHFTGLEYLTTFVLPNFYFHVITAYAILRHNGVALAKRDFLGS